MFFIFQAEVEKVIIWMEEYIIIVVLGVVVVLLKQDLFSIGIKSVVVSILVEFRELVEVFFVLVVGLWFVVVEYENQLFVWSIGVIKFWVECDVCSVGFFFFEGLVFDVEYQLLGLLSQVDVLNFINFVKYQDIFVVWEGDNLQW